MSDVTEQPTVPAVYYVYARSPEGVVEIIRETPQWHTALYEAREACRLRHSIARDMSEHTAEGWSAAVLFTESTIHNVEVQEIAVMSYGYVIGISQRMPVSVEAMRVDVDALLGEEVTLYGEARRRLVDELVAYLLLTS